MGGPKKSRVRVDQPVARILDANLNRAREGIRVIEDGVRFLWDDKQLYTTLRRIRHELDGITRDFFKALILSRDSEQDAGRRLIEGPRGNLTDVLASNMRRAQEAVRVLEEYGKIFSWRAAGRFKKIRFQLYILEKKIMVRL